MLKVVLFVGLISLALGGYVRDKRQVRPYYRPVQPTYAPTTYAPQTYQSGPVYRILRLDNDIYPPGSYRYAYETENGIAAQETGELKGNVETGGTVAQGSYQYTSPEGIPIQTQYVADENGYQPSGIIIAGNGPISRTSSRLV